MSARQFKWQRLTQEDRKRRREAGEAWWQKSAREERQAGRQERRDSGDSFLQRWLDATDDSMPPNLGDNLPGPGTPGDRNSNGMSSYGQGGGFPLWPLLAAGSIAFLILKK